VTSLKLFMAYPDRLMLDDGAIFRAMEISRDLGAIVCLHAETGNVVDALVRGAVAAGHTAPRYHAATRPPEVEAEAVQRAITLASSPGARSTSSTCRRRAPRYTSPRRDAADRRVRRDVPAVLCLDESAYERDLMEAAKYVMSPPLRPRWMQAWLWEALEQADLQAVGTDHCPFWLRDKARGRDDFSKMPNGAPGIEHRLALLYDRGVRAGRLSWPRLVDVFAAAPARIFGLYPKKGALEPGSDRRRRGVRSGNPPHDLDGDAPDACGLRPVRGLRGRGRRRNGRCARRGHRRARDVRGRAGRGTFLRRAPHPPPRG